MIQSRLIRRLSTAWAEIRPLVYPVQRTDPHNVLNMDPVQVSKEVDLDYKRYKMTNYDTKIRVNHFLQAVFSHDITRAVELLQKFREKCTLNKDSEAYVRNVEVYISCLSTLLTYASSKNINAITSRHALGLLCEIFAIPKNIIEERRNQIEGFYFAFITVFLKTLLATPATAKRHASIIRAQITEFTRVHKLPMEDIYQKLKEQSPELIPQFNLVWKTNKPVLASESLSICNIEKYLNEDRSISFAGMCDFLENEHFDMSAYSLDKKAKYYEVYERLNGEKKIKFMKEFREYNKQKQLLVEKYCQDMQTKVIGRQSSPTPLVQKTSQLSWIGLVYDRVCLEIDLLLSGKSQDSPVAKAILQHKFLFELIPRETIVSIMLNTLIHDSVSGTRLAWVLGLTQKMTFMLRCHVGRSKTLSPIFSSSKFFFADEDFITLFSALLKLAVDNSEIESNMLRSFAILDDEHFSKNGNQLFVLAYEKAHEDGPKYKRAGIIKAHPYLLRQSAIFHEIHQNGMHLFPMVHPPKPWTSPKSGGFFGDLAPFVKTLERELTDKYLSQAHIAGQLNSTYESLNALGKLPWTINSDVLSSLKEVLTFSDGFLSIPAPMDELLKEQRPLYPQKSCFADQKRYRSALALYGHQMRVVNQKIANLKSQRVNYEMTAKIASAFDRYGDPFYYPQTLDFRGRVYPAVSILSFHGEDLVRALLCFWEARRLGKNGFNWLKYQLANLFSKNFMSMEDLIKFVEANKSNIKKSAEMPLGGERWWTKADTPWQSLALCIEINKIWNYKGKIEDYPCRIPIHMDGTCNGLQHYAALGANIEAARSVNLLPSERKNDVYLTVLGLVKQRVENDCRSPESEILSLAQEVKRLLSRKVVKQTVMTTVYGVTLFGAYRQIMNRLDDMFNADKSLSVLSHNRASLLLYLSRQVLNAVADLFSEAKVIQSFLKQNAYRCIAAFDKRFLKHSNDVDFLGNNHRKPMMWTSLSGFPVIQNYHTKEIKELRTALQSITLRRTTQKSTINIRKQLNGVAPNFIHSLDAIHLLMTNLAASSHGIAFASVHDSYWTHPSDVDLLNRLIRKEFVRLHSSDVLLNLYKDLEHTNRNALQLVWVENDSNKDFLRGLNQIRGRYGKMRKHKLDQFNYCLNKEFRDNLEVSELVERYNPQLALIVRGQGQAIVYDESSDVIPTPKPVKLTTHTPLLVNMRLIQVPATGELDINEVLNSKFFFS